MEEAQFRDTLDKLAATNSGNEKQEIIAEVADSPAAISFLSGSEFDDAGVGKKTVLSVAREVFDEVSGKPSVSESLESEDSQIAKGMPLSMLRKDMNGVSDKGGNEMKEHLKEMFEFYEYPSIVAHACLDDSPTGVGDSTIASAMGVKDSLPFYDGVVQIAEEDGEPLTEPEVGSAFKPMLAVPESRGQPDNAVAQMKVDGYRVVLHIEGGEAEAFSRRMNRVSDSLPELDEIDWPAGEYIIDAEVIAETGSYSDTSERIGRKAENVDRDVEMNFAVFDAIVYANEEVWTQSYAKRYTHLEGLDVNTDKRVHVLPINDDIEEAKDLAAERGDEGIIVKDWQAPYEFDKRSSSWQKVKMDDETCDLKIAGFEEGEGKASGTLGLVKLETSDGVYVGNSGSGFTDAERNEIWQNKEDWRGRCIEIEARGVGSENKLRMPIYKRERSDDGEPDSWERVQELMQDV